MKRIFLCLCVYVSLCLYAFAQDIRVETEISDRQVVLGDSVRLMISVEGEQDVEPPQVPPVDGLDIRYMGQSTNVSIVNGQYSSAVVHKYSIFPMKVGTYQIPSMVMKVNGRDVATDSVTLDVSASAVGNTAGAMDLSDKMSVVIKTPQTDVYVNEPVPVKVVLLIAADMAVSDIQLPQLPGQGFSVEEFQYKQYQKVIEGVRFSIVEFDTMIYPAVEGSLNVGPAQVSFNLIVNGEHEDSFGSMFGDPFFGSFFGRQERRPVALQSDSLSLNVKPLPLEGRPADFRGAVGQFSFDASVSPTDVQAGDPLTLKMKLFGTGLLSGIDLPVAKESTDFKVYEPSKKSDKNTKILEQVVIPTSENVKEFPSISFSYFDPKDEKYHTITRGPFALNVKPAAQRPAVVASHPSAAVVVPTAPESIGSDIVFIKDEPGHLRPTGRWLHEKKEFHAAVAGYILLWILAMLGLMFRRRVMTDEVFAGRLKASQTARKSLAALRASVSDSDRFYQQLHQLLTEYFSKKLQIPPGAVDASAIRGHASWKGDDDLNGAVKDVFEACESARFSGSEISLEERKKTLETVEAVIRKAERVIK